MNLRCVVIDDEKPARELLINFINKIESLELVGAFKSPLSVTELNWSDVDILFLDIEMGEISGLQFLRTMSVKPYTIVTTAYSEYAIEGFELDIVDYLVKPFPLDRFLTAINKVKSRRGKSLTASETRFDDQQILIIPSDHKTYRIQANQVIYVEGMREYARYHLITGQKIMQLVSLKSLEDSLPKEFIRTHKSYIINRRFVSAFDSAFVELSEHKIPIGKVFRTEVKLSLSTEQ